jgi:hypothetical protein
MATADLGAALGAGSMATLRAGRFTLNLGSRRLVAADDYRNTTNGYTGLHAELKLKGGYAASLIYVLPQVRLPDDATSLLDNDVAFDRESTDLRLWGGLVSRRVSRETPLVELGYFGLHEEDDPGRPTRDRRLHSFSARLLREPSKGGIDYEVEGVYQLGRVSSGLGAAAPRLDVSAWFLHADVGYSFADPWRTRLSGSVKWLAKTGRRPSAVG